MNKKELLIKAYQLKNQGYSKKEVQNLLKSHSFNSSISFYSQNSSIKYTDWLRNNNLEEDKIVKIFNDLIFDYADGMGFNWYYREINDYKLKNNIKYKFINAVLTTSYNHQDIRQSNFNVVLDKFNMPIADNRYLYFNDNTDNTASFKNANDDYIENITYEFLIKREGGLVVINNDYIHNDNIQNLIKEYNLHKLNQ